MFKYVYKISPIDFMDGTITVREYMNSLIEEINTYCNTVLQDGVNVLETKHSGSEHVFHRLEKVGNAIAFICNYFRKCGEEFQSTNNMAMAIRVFSVPVDGECEISYFAKSANNGTTYVFSDLYFPFLNRNSAYIEKSIK